MFCPKCGTENPEQGKFCRKCGTDIAVVSKALGSETHTGFDLMEAGLGDSGDLSGGADCGVGFSGGKRGRSSNDPDELFGGGVRSAIFGTGFLIVSLALYLTNVAGGQAWWWALLIPGFAMLSSGIGNIAKAKRLEKRVNFASAKRPDSIGRRPEPRAIGQAETDFVPADTAQRTKFETGDLVPPSIVEGTTKHLKMDSEGETMTLPDLEKNN